MTPGLAAFGDLAMQLDPVSAERFYSEVASREPRDWKSHDCLGTAYAAQLKNGAALAELEVAKTLAPTEATVRFHTALALAQTGRTDEARGQLAEALRLRPEYPEAREVLGQLSGERPGP